METNSRQQFLPNEPNIQLHQPQFQRQINILSTLQTLWKNEKFSSDLLPYKEQIISQIINIIESREKEINTNPKKLDKETLDIMELDLQRIKFIIKDYLRIRLFKIEKYLYYIIKNELLNLLSQNEIKFASDLIHMKANYFNDALIRIHPAVNNFHSFKDKFKNMKEKIAGLTDNMIVAPKRHSYVIAESITRENIVLNMKDIYNDYDKDFIVLEKGDAAVVPYDLIKEYINNNKVQLI